MTRPVVHRVGSDALLVELPDADATRALYAEVLRRRAAGEFAAVDVVPAAVTVLIDGVDERDRDALVAAVPSWPVPTSPFAAGRSVLVPVRFDGPDLPDVAQAWGVDASEVAKIVCSADLTVAFCGFSPGFAYLAGLGRSVPRRLTPRPYVPAGSVALAGDYAGIYPRSSPGGWQIIGTAVDVVLWDVAREPAALLEPGVRVTFVAEHAA